MARTPAPLTPTESAAVTVAVLAVVGFGIFGEATAAPSTVAYVCTVAGLGALVGRLRRAPLPPALAMALAVLAVAHLAGGLVRVGDDVLYNASLRGALFRYDHLVHGSAVFVGTLLVWTLLVAPAVPASYRSTAAVVLAVLGGLALGGLNETIEFLTTTAHGGAHVGGYTNTGWDLVSNAVGAGAAGVFLVRRQSSPA